MRRWALPLASLACALLLGLLAWGMQQERQALPSARLGQLWPARALAQLGAPGLVQIQQWQGQARIVNLWASWCGTCQEEHPLLMQLAATLRAQGRAAQLIGLNYKDDAAQASAWLARWGNPYATTVVDADGRLAINLGVYGAPETFVLDAQGRIVFRHVGALTPEVLARELLPRLNAAPTEVPPGTASSQRAPAPTFSPSVNDAAGFSPSTDVTATASANTSAPAWTQAQADRLYALSAELRCLVCQNESLADSRTALALDLKREMATQIAAGASDAQIRDFLVQRYGDFIRYRPPFAAHTWLLWLAPLGLLLAGVAWLLRTARRPAPAPENLEKP